MPSTAFYSADFKVFDEPGFKGRMTGIRERLRPKLEAIGHSLTQGVARATGGDGRDTIYGQLGDDALFCGGGSDRLFTVGSGKVDQGDHVLRNPTLCVALALLACAVGGYADAQDSGRHRGRDFPGGRPGGFEVYDGPRGYPPRGFEPRKVRAG